MMERETYTADLGGERLDLFLVRQQPDLSRSHVQKRITRGDVLVDGKVRKANYKLNPGEQVDLLLAPPAPASPPCGIRDRLCLNSPRCASGRDSAGADTFGCPL